ncbi:MAG: acetoacetate--CoA ligase [Planctomycetota bacterium]
MSGGELLWKPSVERAQRSAMYSFMLRMSRKYGFLANWQALHPWSIQHREEFWGEMWELSDIRATSAAEAICVGKGIRETQWFPGLEFNFAEHLLRFDDDRPAILAEDELERRRDLTFRELRNQVARCAVGLREAGVARGDRVGGFLPNIPEAVVAMLATASLGAIWSSCSPDFGIQGVFDRFGQIEPKVLIAADGYTYNGKPIDSMERVAGIVKQIPSIRKVVIVPFLKSDPDVAGIPNGASWSTFVSRFEPLTFASVPFDHPLYIMYSSGTTGVPKCIVHGAGGTVLQHMKELMLHTDLHAEDRIFFFTTCGWMMWNWLVSSLGVGAAVVLYEGSPFHPDPHQLWRMTEKLGITVFGTSPKYVMACQNAGLHPGRDHDLSKLRAVLSTGSPLTVEGFHWVYSHVKSDLQLSSICGGTDIISCFMLGNPILPVYAGEIQCLGLGMDSRAFDSEGKAVIGKQGELVCCSPFPSRPVNFWNDPDGKKYHKAYFEHYEGIWRHGDFVAITERGGVIVYGRSDATLNPGGVRIGTAEIYRQLDGMDEIVDSVVVGKRSEDADVDICLFVVLKPSLTLDEPLVRRIKQRIADGATKRHVPKFIKQVSAVPYTISGKKVELAVNQMIHGEPVPNRDALANPEALGQYAGIV